MIDLVGKRFWFILASAAVIIPGVIAIVLGGLRPGIDFTGGYRLTVVPETAQAYDVNTFKDTLVKAGYADVVVRRGTIGESPNVTDTITIDFPKFTGLTDKGCGLACRQEKSNVALTLKNANLVAAQLVSDTVPLETTAPTGSGTPAPGVTAGVTVTATISNPVTSTATIARPTAAGTVTSTTSLTSTGTVTATGTTTTTTATTGTTGGTPPAVQQISVWRVNPSIDDYTIGPTVGQELVGRAFFAVLLASIAILIYLTLVFRKVPNAFRYGVCAVIALLHDVLVVTGIFAILGLLIGIEIDALFITAMLTVIGFSVHDTIVVFDRVRENIMRRRFERFEDVVNYSLVQTLARSINTSITVLLTLFALYMFGGASIREFVLALLIGIISGTYSSIFNASMLLVIWERREWRGPGRAQATPAPTTARRTATR